MMHLWHKSQIGEKFMGKSQNGDTTQQNIGAG